MLDMLQEANDDEESMVEWYIELFLGVHFAANWVPVH
jgi:hypothetical protein